MTRWALGLLCSVQVSLNDQIEKVSRGSLLQDRLVEFRFSQELLQASVLFFNLLESLGLIHLVQIAPTTA